MVDSLHDFDDPVDWIYARARRLGLDAEQLHDRLARELRLQNPDHARRRLNHWKGEGCQPRGDGLRALSAVLEVALDVVTTKFREREPRYAALYVRNPEPHKGAILTKLRGNLEQQGWRCVSTDYGDGCSKPNFNVELVVDRPVIPLERQPGLWDACEHYSSDLKGFVLADLRRRSGDFHNDLKIRISSDFPGKDVVVIEQTDYRSSAMTDQLGWDRIASMELRPDLGPRRVIRSIISFIDIKTSRLKGFGENEISNQIGASTLAFSRDGHLMIVVQNKRNMQSANLLAPSGSGSLDWSDVTASGADDLVTLIQYGAQRELREECALDDANGQRSPIASKVLVTGFVRMLHRAGKPEFFCFGCIDAPSDQIKERKPERYVDRVYGTPDRANWKSGRPSSEIARVCKSYLASRNQIPMSYPLEHGLILLDELCADESAASALDRFVLDTFG